MINTFRCFECDAPARAAHHVVPRSMGGTRTLPLCEPCHALADGRTARNVNRSKLIRKGIERARANGKGRWGRPKVIVPHDKIEALERCGFHNKTIAEVMGCSVTTIKRWRRGFR